MIKSVKKLDSDVVVVGAGPGGCTVAKELSQRGKKVILIEKYILVQRSLRTSTTGKVTTWISLKNLWMRQ
jgi:choline dehydrogenase-like flavoprotein